MYRKQVHSSAIKEIGYNAEKEILEVMFTNDTVYQYVKFKFETYTDLVEAQSVGSHFMKKVKNAYPCVRIQ